MPQQKHRRPRRRVEARGGQVRPAVAAPDAPPVPDGFTRGEQKLSNRAEWGAVAVVAGRQGGSSGRQPGQPPCEQRCQQRAIGLPCHVARKFVELGNLAHSGFLRSCDAGRMKPASVRIAARKPILRAGLERIAHAAEVDLSDSRDADLVLRAYDVAADDSAIDVAISRDAIVVTCRSQPEPSVWQALLRIIRAAAIDGSAGGR